MDESDLYERLRATPRNATEIRALAAELACLAAAPMEAALNSALETGDSAVVSRALQVAGCLGLRLDPRLLCQCIEAAEGSEDPVLCFAVQGAEAVEPLLKVIVDPGVSVDRRMIAGRISAELAVKFDLDRKPVQKALGKLEGYLRLTGIDAPLLAGCHIFLWESGKPGNDGSREGWYLDHSLEETMGIGEKRQAIHFDAPVRRPVAKLGRNDPCHCGSGKKYKKCCFDKDQERLRDPSEFAGLTLGSLRENPGMVDDPAVIQQMRPFHLKRLAPERLSDRQLIPAFRRALVCRFFPQAFAILEEKERREGPERFDSGFFDDLLLAALNAGDLETAKRIDELYAGADWLETSFNRFAFDLLENPASYKRLEALCRESLGLDADDEYRRTMALVDIFHTTVRHFPALGIVFGRAAILTYPDSHLDNSVILEMLQEARIELDLEPWDEPVETLLEWIEERDRRDARKDAESEKSCRLDQELQAARTALEQKRRDLLEKEAQLQGLNRQLARVGEAAEREATGAARIGQGAPQRGAPEQNLDEKGDQKAEWNEEREGMLVRLRRQVANLKAEIGEQQRQRRQLRKELEEERSRAPAPTPEPERPEPGPAQAAPEPSGRILIPEYAPAFRRHCQELPASVAAEALLAAGSFAAHDPAIWRRTKPLERLLDHYRIRIGIDHRLLMKWKPGETLEILDIIPRQELESWIKRHG